MIDEHSMGQDIKCRVDFGKESSLGKALLETSELVFRGDFRLKIPFAGIRDMQVSAGRLAVQFENGSAVFHLGDAAEKWASRIRNPPSRLDKLGVKPGTKVKLIGRHDADFRRELTSRGAVTTRSKPDLVFLAVNNKEELVELAYQSDGAVWIVYPKGIEAITQNDVIKAGRAAGLIDIKVCGFSPTHTALKFTPRR
jgi:predicted molibdopterin-dependent oxidoreductase YjgC